MPSPPPPSWQMIYWYFLYFSFFPPISSAIIEIYDVDVIFFSHYFIWEDDAISFQPRDMTPPSDAYRDAFRCHARAAEEYAWARWWHYAAAIYAFTPKPRCFSSPRWSPADETCREYEYEYETISFSIEAEPPPPLLPPPHERRAAAVFHAEDIRRDAALSKADADIFFRYVGRAAAASLQETCQHRRHTSYRHAIFFSFHDIYLYIAARRRWRWWRSGFHYWTDAEI